jgi:5'(3')-deoxyribonucleotidase
MASADRSIQSEQSQRIFWVIQTIFAVLLAKTFFDYKECILAPFSKEHYLLTLGLLLVYTTALLSWIDYSFTTIVSPYRFGGPLRERFRFLVDLLIVVLYAFMLFSLESLKIDKGASISQLLLGLFLVFLLYYFSGVLRIRQYGKRASRRGLISIFLFVYLILFTVYTILFRYVCLIQRERLNAIFIVLAWLLMIAYRIVRERVARRRNWIAVDIDGVLANQIEGVLPIIKTKYGVDLNYKDIKMWDLQIKDTNIASIIVEEQGHREYVMSMPLHKGARETMDKIVQKYMIAIVTARATDSDTWSIQWLRKNQIPYDEIIHTAEEGKQNTKMELSVLIDDYIGNIKLFLEKSNGKAILFSQPWNIDRSKLTKFLEEGRVKVVDNWGVIPKIIAELIGSNRDQ